MHSAWARISSAKQSHKSVTAHVEIDITLLESLLKSKVRETAPSANAADTSAVPSGKALNAPGFLRKSILSISSSSHLRKSAENNSWIYITSV